MIFRFSHDGKTYDYDDKKMGLGEARWVKNNIGLVGTEFFEAARKLDPDAVVALLILAMRRAGESVDIDDIDDGDDDNGYFRLIEGMTIEDDAPPPNRAARRAKKE